MQYITQRASPLYKNLRSINPAMMTRADINLIEPEVEMWLNKSSNQYLISTSNKLLIKWEQRIINLQLQMKQSNPYLPPER